MFWFHGLFAVLMDVGNIWETDKQLLIFRALFIPHSDL